MELHSAYSPLSLRHIEPEGWLRAYLERQRHGLTGHLEVAGYPFNSPTWSQPSFASQGHAHWWPYEQAGYWIDGLVRCGHLLRDPFLLQKAQEPIDYVLKHPDKDGYLGPKGIKEPMDQSRWAHAVFFRAMTAHHSATGDDRIVAALQRHYLSNTSPHSFHREIANLETVLWTYEKTGDKRLLQHAVDAYDEFNKLPIDETVDAMLSAERSRDHGVSYNEVAKIGAIMYKYTGNERYLQATENAFRKMEKHSMLLDGVPSSSERLRDRNPLDSHETCDIADYTWSIGHLLEITGKSEYADKIERACFNAAPGAVTPDFKALQYFSCANQVIAHDRSNHNIFHAGIHWMAYRPNPGTECCAGNVHRIMPNFAARMWMRDTTGGIVAALYGPSRITFRPEHAKSDVTIVEETGYPFTEEISFRIQCDEAVQFPLVLRIPGWCRAAELYMNGIRQKRRFKAGTFFTLARTFQPNDRITLVLPMELKLSYWPHGGMGIERGPLVYALAIEEEGHSKQVKGQTSKDFPAWELRPASRWNYALALDERNLADVEVLQGPLSDNPWTLTTAPVELRVPARLVKNWRLIKTKWTEREYHVPGAVRIDWFQGDYEFTPDLPDPETLRDRLGKDVEMIRLVPYGCTNLRLSVFPHVAP
jgi:hypothetical protein